MSERYFNPFGSIKLNAPQEQRSIYDEYCQTQRNSPNIDLVPFPRMVDLWFMGFSIAAKEKLKPVDLSDLKTFKIIEGSIFDSDLGRIQIIMLTAINIANDVEVVTKPNNMMNIANGLAAAGVPFIQDMLKTGQDDPIWNLTEALDDILR